MSGKEQFQKIKKQTPYISKDGKFYAIKFYDEKNDCCHYMVTDSHKGKSENKIPTYEDACKLYNIELEETIPTPDQYFLKKVDEESNTNILRTVSDATFIRYTKDHKEDCTESIEKLKAIVCTHKDKKVRKAAYETCVEIGVDGIEGLQKYIDTPEITEVEEIAGHGVTAVVDNHKIAVGSNKMVLRYGLPPADTGDAAGTIVHVIVDGEYRGFIVIADEIKEDAFNAVGALRNLKETVMLTGDTDAIGRSVAARLKLDKVYTELLPGDKVEKVEAMMQNKSAKGKLVFVGDGINDAPVLARADLGIAMGGLGSDAAIEAADIVIMTDEPSKIATAIKISKKTLTIVRQNIILSLAVKFGVLILGAAGLATMWAAVFADVGVSVIAVLNAARILSKKQYM